MNGESGGLRGCVAELVAERRPRAVLALGERVVAWLPEGVECVPFSPVEANTLQGRYDLALVDAAELQCLDPEQTTQLIGRLRDRHAACLAIAEPIAAADCHERFVRHLALGLYRWRRCREEENGWDLYRFDMEHYKPSPRWLNSRHWAHPELFGKYRW